MAILDKIFFWRKKGAPAPAPGAEKPPGLGLPGEEELGLPTEGKEPAEAGLPPGPSSGAAEPLPGKMPAHEPPEAPTPSPSAMPPGFAPQPPMAQPSKDLELISSKLDVLKASLDSINQRLANLERMASGEHEVY